MNNVTRGDRVKGIGYDDLLLFLTACPVTSTEIKNFLPLTLSRFPAITLTLSRL